MAMLRATTLNPEWAWAVLHLDMRVKNLSERDAHVLARYDGLLAIHAGAWVMGRPGLKYVLWGKDAVRKAAEQVGLPDPFAASVFVARATRKQFVRISPSDAAPDSPRIDLVHSAIVAVCRTGMALPPTSDRPWQTRATWAVELRDVTVLPQAVPCPGTRGLWTLPTDVEAAVRVQVQNPPSTHHNPFGDSKGPL